MIRCVLIDDEPLAIELLQKYIRPLPDLSVTAGFTDAIAAAHYLDHNPADLLFLDVHMPDMTGLQLLRQLRTKPLLILTTAHREYAVDGFNLSAVDYLLKPFSQQRFLQAVEKVLRQFQQQAVLNDSQADYLFVKSQYKLIRIALEEINYIEGLIDYVRIHTDSYLVTTLSSMKGMLQKLPAGKFIRIHRSYIVPVNKISHIRNKKIGLFNNIELPIGDTYQPLLKHLQKKAK